MACRKISGAPLRRPDTNIVASERGPAGPRGLLRAIGALFVARERRIVSFQKPPTGGVLVSMKKTKKANLTIIALAVFSLVYLVVIWRLVTLTHECAKPPQGEWESVLLRYVSCRTTNELGDFLAGAFAPLAFIWLAGTVFIQSRELAEQREELRLTREEHELARRISEDDLRIRKNRENADAIEIHLTDFDRSVI